MEQKFNIDDKVYVVLPVYEDCVHKFTFKESKHSNIAEVFLIEGSVRGIMKSGDILVYNISFVSKNASSFIKDRHYSTNVINMISDQLSTTNEENMFTNKNDAKNKVSFYITKLSNQIDIRSQQCFKLFEENLYTHTTKQQILYDISNIIKMYPNILKYLSKQLKDYFNISASVDSILFDHDNYIITFDYADAETRVLKEFDLYHLTEILDILLQGVQNFQ